MSLAEKPITLITGANGSGKTQILDALILSLGYHPKRLKKGKISDMVGPFEETARIELCFQNPKIQGKRSLLVPDKEILSLLDSDSLKIFVDIDRKDGIEYSLESQGKTHRMPRKDIRSIFETINIRADNKLAFTEEGTVNIFADHSSKNKLELLLETIGLNVYRENLVSALDSIQKASHAIAPLRRKLVIEKEYLKSMEKAREILAQKSELLKQYDLLVREEAWSYVAQEEKKHQEILDSLTKKKKENKEQAQLLYQKQEEKDAKKKEMQGLEAEKDFFYKKLEKDKSQLRVLDGRNDSNRKMIQNHEQKIAEFEKKKEVILDSQAFQEERKKLFQEKLSSISKEKERLSRIMQAVGTKFFGESLRYERILLQKSLEFYHLAQEKKIELFGPLFYEIQKEKSITSQDLSAFSAIMGKYLFAFLACEEKAFHEAVALWEEFDRQEPCEIFVLFAPIAKGKKIKSPVLNFIQNFFPSEIVASYEDAFEILARAKEKNLQIFSQGKIFLPWPAIGSGRVWESILCCQKLSLEEIQDALDVNQKYKELQREEEDLQRELLSFSTDNELSRLEERIDELKKEKEILEQEIEENMQQSQDLHIRIDENTISYQEKIREIEAIEEVLHEKQQQIHSLENLQQAIERLISRLLQDQEEQDKKLQESIEKAREKGDRPEELRGITIASQEKNQLQGKLEALQVSPISEEEFLAQEDRVRKLEVELSGTDQHIQSLKNDMETRFEKWHQEVLDKIKGISHCMNELLATLVQGVRLRIDNWKNPDEAGLVMEIQRNSDRWHDLAHLSGGEKVLAVESLILSLHLQTDSPLHAIDECTQRLDMKFKAQAFDMVRKAILHISKYSQGIFAPQFILLAPDTLGVDFSQEMDSYFKRIVLSVAKLKSDQKKVNLLNS